jgi:hypothetical protein
VARNPWKNRFRLLTPVAIGIVAGIFMGWVLIQLLILR